VLHEVSFTAAPGQTVALVSQTGSGKTSIISLLAKLYLPSACQIFIDGHDLAEVSSRSLHEHMGSVPQSNFLFSGTLLATRASVGRAPRRPRSPTRRTRSAWPI
jgi:ABC-type multidrug transport system fused ATPase/permease subunit